MERNNTSKSKNFEGNKNNKSNNSKFNFLENEDKRKNSLIYDPKQENLFLNGYNKNLGYKQNSSSYNNLNLMKSENALLKKRHRLSSYEVFFGIERENFGNLNKKLIDDNEIFNSFCKEFKYDFNEEEIEKDLLEYKNPTFNPLGEFRPKDLHGIRRSFRNMLPMVKVFY